MRSGAYRLSQVLGIASLCLGWAAGCGSGTSSGKTPPPSDAGDAARSNNDAGTPDGATTGADAAASGQLVEQILTLELSMTISTGGGDAGASAPKGGASPGADGSVSADGPAATSDGAADGGPPASDGADGSSADGASPSADGPASGTDGGPATSAVTTLVITARDGTTPLVTDLWLYTLEASGKVPITTFTSTGARKTPRLMLPATIDGQPSGLTPADDGRQNGLMTNTTRGKLVQGAFVSTVDGTVTVTLPGRPTAPILVIAGVEDQRYTGAAVINPDGSPGAVPDGTILLETHVRRSFERDVKPLLFAQCAACHNPQGTLDADLYLVTGTRDELVNDNFALKEQTEDCQKATPNDQAAQAVCVQAINKAQFLIEPGAPALSDVLQRARPDEMASTSPLGLPWYGSKGSRYNTTYGDRRMPSTADTPDMTMWKNLPTYFDMHPADYQVLYDWVAQGAPP